MPFVGKFIVILVLCQFSYYCFRTSLSDITKNQSKSKVIKRSQVVRKFCCLLAHNVVAASRRRGHR